MRRRWFRRVTQHNQCLSFARTCYVLLSRARRAAAVTLATTGIQSRRASYAGHKRSAAILEVHARESIRIAGDKRISREAIVARRVAAER
ncbi:jg9764 [Pararge aegeria aegeria]|uniref:Jg9764 protein n=1 Tax=Pararge aegeria aegeria TaxID=348720 RepID=A0A8S4QYU1_9NEOP|nr:jg9764 [Pararge aegeria aegeria]